MLYVTVRPFYYTLKSLLVSTQKMCRHFYAQKRQREMRGQLYQQLSKSLAFFIPFACNQDYNGTAKVLS
jgi:hypothetical protein